MTKTGKIMYLAVYVIVIGCLTTGLVAYPQDYSNRLYKRNADDLEKHVYHIPSRLKVGYVINVTGQLKTAKKSITFSLWTGDKNNALDGKNATCEARFDFVDNSVTIAPSHNNIDLNASDMIKGANFAVAFRVSHQMHIELNYDNGSISGSGCDLQDGKIQEIRYLTVRGTIEKVAELKFTFD